MFSVAYVIFIIHIVMVVKSNIIRHHRRWLYFKHIMIYSYGRCMVGLQCRVVSWSHLFWFRRWYQRYLLYKTAWISMTKRVYSLDRLLVDWSVVGSQLLWESKVDACFVTPSRQVFSGDFLVNVPVVPCLSFEKVSFLLKLYKTSVDEC